MPRLPHAIAVVVLLTVGITACGTSDESLGSAPTTASTLAPATTAPRSTLPGPVATSSTTTTLGEYATSPNGVIVSNLTLKSDGVGSFRFDAPADEVRFGLVSSLGPTTEADDVIGTDRLDCDPTPATVMHWGAFQVAFVGEPGEATFVGYDLFGPPVNAGLATTTGLTVGQSYEQAAAILGAGPPVQQDAGALVLGGLGGDAPVVEVGGSAPTDLLSRMTAGDLPTCGLPPDDGNYEEG